MTDFNSIVNKFQAEKKIGEHTFTIKKLSAFEVLKHGKALLSLVLPVLGSGIDAMRNGEDEYGVSTTFADLSVLVCEQLDKFEMEALVAKLLAGATKDGKNYKLDDLMSDDVGEMLEVFAWALEVNFHDFFMKNPLTARFRDQIQDFMGVTSEE